MNIFEKLSNHEVEMISSYIDCYAYMEKDISGRKASVEQILQTWAKNKEKLFHVFGDQFIIERPVSFHVPIDELAEQIECEYSVSDSPYYIFRNAMYEIVIEGSDVPLRLDYSTNRWLLTLILSNADCLASNTYDNDKFSIALPNGKSVVFEAGCKPIRLLGKVAKAYGLEEEFEKFRLWHSQKLNQKLLTGTICLSIHPLDYMTMSDNNCDWSSCMSWQEEGCYRSGTVECMNSPLVVVAYLKAKNDMDIPGGLWNNKKWRCLFIVSDDVVTNIKGYPYQHDELNQSILSWLKELLPDNYGEPTKYESYGHGIKPFVNGIKSSTPKWGIRYYTSGHMYNDFGSCYHMGMFNEANMCEYNPNYNKDNILMIDYSGPNVCMRCGAVGCYMPGDETDLCCVECSIEPCICHCCDCEIESGNVYELDGYQLCEECYYENRAVDPFTCEECYEPDMYNLYLVPDEVVDKASTIAKNSSFSQYFTRMRVHANFMMGDIIEESYKEFFTCSRVNSVQRWWSNYYFITPNDLTDKGYNLVNDWLENECGETYAEYAAKVCENVSQI